MHKVAQQSNRKSKRVLLCVLLLLFFDILCENFIVSTFDRTTRVEELVLSFGFMVLQIVFAPIQAGFSDFSGRKRSILVSLSVSFVSLVIIWLFLGGIAPFFLTLTLAGLVKAIWGNNLPLAYAAVGDTQVKNIRFAFAQATAAYAIAYLFLIVSKTLFQGSVFNFFLLSFVILLILLYLFAFEDPKAERDASDHSCDDHGSVSMVKIFKKEIKLILQLMKDLPTTKALIAFVFWEISMYSILISEIDFESIQCCFVASTMMIGYLLGVGALRFCFQVSDKTIIKIGYWVSFLSLIPSFILLPIVQNIVLVLQVCYFFHAFGNAFLSSALMSVLGKGRGVHELGKIYGIVDSLDTVSFLLSALFIMAYNAYKFPLMYLIAFSFISFSVSWLFYNRFRNIKE